MKCILSHTTDPYFNLAAEEYLLKNFNDSFYFQYVNEPSVVIGKHQNALAEIDTEFLKNHGIHLARRISGGGAVYHDHGNMNYSFITTEKPGDLVKFETYTAPVIAALDQFGVNAFLGKRNEILADKGKISGTASHVFKSRVLHHGTLLYDTDLEMLAGCLYTDPAPYKDKAVKSVRSEVVNLKELVRAHLETQDFFDFVFKFILNAQKDNNAHIFSGKDITEIESLCHEKFRTWAWNYGYSPRYTVERKVNGIHFITSVEKGKIIHIEITGIGHPEIDHIALRAITLGLNHDKGSIGRELTKKFDAATTGLILQGIF
ncbi:MAG: lipoate--protein ligase [Bacteroidales bacterium]